MGDDAARGPGIDHRRVLIVFSGLVLVMLLAALDSTIVSTALPTIVGELGGLDHLSWVVTAYLLAQTIVTPLYGKLGDLYGRKRVMQVGIIIFLLGSALCGLSTSMLELILFRALQGLGGGGLTVTAQAVIGDIVPPRDRGRYQGIFGAVFGISSVAGPLLGGYFVSNLTWRWIFYINLPLGILALVVIAAALPAREGRVRHAIDYLGAGLLALALSAIVLVTDLGGVTYPWSSPMIIGLIVASVVGLVGFILAERRAREPVLPLRLFGNRSFAFTSAIGLVVGFALFGSVTFLPLYLQVVKGVSPTASGMQMLPMMGGMLLTSIGSGQLISRFGRYKIFPIIGTAVMTFGMFLLSRIAPDTSTLGVSMMMLLLGLGLGMVMQVLVIAVQNSVDYRDLGVATSGATLFRLVGGSVGTAVLGAIFSTTLASNLARVLPPGAVAGGGGFGGMNAAALAHLPAEIRGLYLGAFTDALDTIFFFAAVVGLVAFLLTWLVPEQPLRKTVAAATEDDIGGDVAQAFAMPVDDQALPHLARGLAVLADRDVLQRHISAIVALAGVDLSPAAAWLLVRLEREPGSDIVTVGARNGMPREQVEEIRDDLLRRGLIEAPAAEGASARLTGAGCDVFNRLAAARREHLGELWSDWSTEKRKEMAELLRRLANDLVPEAHPGLEGNMKLWT